MYGCARPLLLYRALAAAEAQPSTPSKSGKRPAPDHPSSAPSAKQPRPSVPTTDEPCPQPAPRTSVPFSDQWSPLKRSADTIALAAAAIHDQPSFFHLRSAQKPAAASPAQPNAALSQRPEQALGSLLRLAHSSPALSASCQPSHPRASPAIVAQEMAEASTPAIEATASTLDRLGLLLSTSSVGEPGPQSSRASASSMQDIAGGA